MLTDAAIEAVIDRLNGLKENVIIGKLIPPRPVSSSNGTSRSSRPIRCPSHQHLEAEAELLAALEEIGEGDGFDLNSLGLGLEELKLDGGAAVSEQAPEEGVLRREPRKTEWRRARRSRSFPFQAGATGGRPHDLVSRPAPFASASGGPRARAAPLRRRRS